MSLYEYRCRVRRIIGPVSLDVDIDYGFRAWQTHPVRLDGLAQPSAEHRKQTIEAVGNWLAAHNTDGLFTVHTIKETREKYGRYLAVLIADDGAELNEDLLSSGLVTPYRDGAPAGD